MKIGIINSGNIGRHLALSWVRHGHKIMLGREDPSKVRQRLKALAVDQGVAETELAELQYGSLIDAAKFGDVIIFSVYFPRLGQVLKELESFEVTLANKIVIDTMNPVNVTKDFVHFHDTAYMDKTSTTENLQRSFPQARVFKAFNSLPAPLLNASMWEPGKVPPIIYLGGESASADVVRQLIQDAGFRPLSAGYNVADAGLLERLGVLAHRLAQNEFDGDSNIGFTVLRQGGSK